MININDIRPRFDCYQPTIPHLFVNRGDELKTAFHVLFRDKQNLLVTGKHLIGKTSFLVKIIDEINKQPDLQIFPVYLFMFDIHYKNFLCELITKLCISIAETIFSSSFLEINEALFHHTNLKNIKNKNLRTLLRIYRVVRSVKSDIKRRSSREIGAKAIASAKVNEQIEINQTLKDLSNYEFLKIISELNKILNDNNYNKILVFFDEANKLSEEMNISLLRNYFEIFLSQNIQSVFVTVPSATTKIPDLSQAFGAHIKLDKFLDTKCVEELVRLVYDEFESRGGKPIPFESESYQKIYNICDGEPFYIQEFCKLIYDYAVKVEKKSIDTQLISKYIIETYKLKKRNDI